MSRPRRRCKRKCLHCGTFFLPDPRTHDRQRHCPEPACKRASKRRAQQRWLSKTENQGYFRGEQNTARVQAWRKAHPQYWRKKPPVGESTLQDDCPPQPTEQQSDRAGFDCFALQEDSRAQLIVMLGLISSTTGHTLQDDIGRTLRHLHARGRSILGMAPGG